MAKRQGVVIPYDPSILERMQKIGEARRLTPEQQAAKAAILASLERQEAEVGIRPPRAAEENQSEAHLGDGKITVGMGCFNLTPRETFVIQALVEMRSLTKRELETKSGVEDAVRVLRRLLAKHPELRPFIAMAGRGHSGGYRTTISPA